MLDAIHFYDTFENKTVKRIPIISSENPQNYPKDANQTINISFFTERKKPTKTNTERGKKLSSAIAGGAHKKIVYQNTSI